MLIQRFKRPGFLRDVFAVSSGSAVSQVLAIAASPILMRIYSPAELGIQAICISILFVGVIGSMRYNQAIPLPEKLDESIRITFLALFVLAVMTILVGFCLHLFIKDIAAFTKAPKIIEFIGLLIVIFLFIGTSEILLSITLRLKKFRRLGQAQIAQTLVQLGYQVIVGLNDPTAQSLVEGMLFGNLAAIIVYTLGIYASFKLMPRINLSELRRVAVAYSKFPLLASPSSLINGASIQATPLLLAAFYSPEVVGLLALAQRVIGLPVTTIGYGVSQVFFQRSAEVQNQTPAELLALYTKAARALLVISILPITVLALTGPQVFSIIFGERWSDAGLYASLLAPMFISQFVVSPLSTIMAVISAQKQQLMWDVTRLVAIGTTVVVAGQLNLDAVYCIAMYGACMTLCYIWLYLLTRKQILNKNKAHLTL